MKTISTISKGAGVARRLAVTLTAAVMALATAAAQDSNRDAGTGATARMPNREQMIAQRVERLTRELNLTAEQQAGVKKILESAPAPEKQQGGKPDFAAMNKQREETDNQIKALLNDDQAMKYAELQKKGGRGHMGGRANGHKLDKRGGHNRGDGMRRKAKGPNAEMRLNNLRDELQLTEEQQAKMKAILDKARNEQKQDTQENIRELDENIKAILTDDQKAKYEQLKAARTVGRTLM